MTVIEEIDSVASILRGRGQLSPTSLRMTLSLVAVIVEAGAEEIVLRAGTCSDGLCFSGLTVVAWVNFLRKGSV